MRSWLLAALAALPTTATATNFLVVVFDDVGTDKVGAYAGDFPGYAPAYLPDTPTWDELADLGLRFTTVYASPMCSPTRASLLTGRRPFQHKVGDAVGTGNAPDLALSEVTLAEMLGDSAYGTAYTSGWFGKWHLYDDPSAPVDWTAVGETTERTNAEDQGFAAFAGSLPSMPEDYYAWTRVSGPRTLSTGGTGSVIELSTTYATDDNIASTLDWIGEQAGEWLAVVAFNAAHSDRERFTTAYEANDLGPDSTCADRDGDGRCAIRELFGALVTDADDRLDGMLAELAETSPEVLEDTVIVVLGDNGTHADVLEAPFLPSGERTTAGKSTAYESGVRVPLTITSGCDWVAARYGSTVTDCAAAPFAITTPGLAVTAPVQVEDLFATLADLAGSAYTPPEGSVSLVPCFAATAGSASTCGTSELNGRRQYAEVYSRSGEATSGYAAAGTFAARRGTKKIVGTISSDASGPCTRYELYDLAIDPYETNDLLAGGDVLTRAQSTARLDLVRWVRTTLVVDWLRPRVCTA